MLTPQTPGRDLKAREELMEMLAAVQSDCAVVTDADLPAQYQGAIYDCQGFGSALAQD